MQHVRIVLAAVRELAQLGKKDEIEGLLALAKEHASNALDELVWLENGHFFRQAKHEKLAPAPVASDENHDETWCAPIDEQEGQ